MPSAKPMGMASPLLKPAEGEFKLQTALKWLKSWALPRQTMKACISKKVLSTSRCIGYQVE